MQESPHTSNYMQSPAAADYLGISIHTLHRWTSQKRIPFFKPNGKVLYFLKTDLDSWIARNRTSAPYECVKESK